MASVGQIIAACYYCKWTLLAICNEAGLTGWNQSRSNVCWLEGVVNKVRPSKHNKASHFNPVDSVKETLMIMHRSTTNVLTFLPGPLSPSAPPRRSTRRLCNFLWRFVENLWNSLNKLSRQNHEKCESLASMTNMSATGYAFQELPF